jgi:hypothetical protein
MLNKCLKSTSTSFEKSTINSTLPLTIVPPRSLTFRSWVKSISEFSVRFGGTISITSMSVLVWKREFFVVILTKIWFYLQNTPQSAKSKWKSKIINCSWPLKLNWLQILMMILPLYFA